MRTDRHAVHTSFILEAQHSDLPEDIVEEVRKLWRDAEFGNDNFYYFWDSLDGEEPSLDTGTYPLIAKYLHDKNITECLIHWWW